MSSATKSTKGKLEIAQQFVQDTTINDLLQNHDSARRQSAIKIWQGLESRDIEALLARDSVLRGIQHQIRINIENLTKPNVPREDDLSAIVHHGFRIYLLGQELQNEFKPNILVLNRLGAKRAEFLMTTESAAIIAYNDRLKIRTETPHSR